MGSSKTKTDTKEQAVTQPNIPSYAQPAITNYFDSVANANLDPSMFATPANSTQTAAVAAANNLGGWQSGLNSSNSLAQGAANTSFAPITSAYSPLVNLGAAPEASVTNATSAQLGPANQASAAGLLDNGLSQYLNPATQQLVDTTLSGFDANSGQVRAQQQAAAARGGAFGGSRYGVAQAQTEEDLARARANTEAGLRATAFDKATSLAQSDAANRQQTNLFNTGAQNDFALNQGAFDQQTNQFNAGAANNNSQFNTGLQAQYGLTGAQLGQQNNQFNAGVTNSTNQFNSGLKQQQVANQLQAAGLLGSNASAGGQLAQGDVATQLNAGNTLYGIQQQQALAPYLALQAQQGLLDPALLQAISGQTINTTGTSTSKQSGGLLGSLIGAGAQLGGAAILASDPRVKRDIELLETAPDGLGVYRYNYLWDDPDMPARIGVMADEVEILRPWALGPIMDGIQTVDYSKLEAG